MADLTFIHRILIPALVHLTTGLSRLQCCHRHPRDFRMHAPICTNFRPHIWMPYPENSSSTVTTRMQMILSQSEQARQEDNLDRLPFPRKIFFIHSKRFITQNSLRQSRRNMAALCVCFRCDPHSAQREALPKASLETELGI